MTNLNGTNSNETMAELYDRRDGETPQAYEAARAYFELGSDRSLVAAAQKCNKGVSILGRWSAKWDWAARARAWDDVRQTGAGRRSRQGHLRDAGRVLGCDGPAKYEQGIRARSLGLLEGVLNLLGTL